MDIRTCPFCSTQVVVNADGTCPSCRTQVGPAAIPTKPGPTGNPFGESPFSTAPQAGGPQVEVNPYAAPPTPYAQQKPGFAAAQQRGGLMWLLFSFEGRIPRRSYWGGHLGSSAVFLMLVFASAVIVAAAVAPTDAVDEDAMAAMIMIPMLILYIPFLWISAALQVKRWHDRDKSGWWFLINFIPYVGPIWVLIEVGCLRGTFGPNAYGPDPT